MMIPSSHSHGVLMLSYQWGDGKVVGGRGTVTDLVNPTHHSKLPHPAANTGSTLEMAHWITKSMEEIVPR